MAMITPTPHNAVVFVLFVPFSIAFFRSPAHHISYTNGFSLFCYIFFLHSIEWTRQSHKNAKAQYLNDREEKKPSDVGCLLASRFFEWYIVQKHTKNKQNLPTNLLVRFLLTGTFEVLANAINSTQLNFPIVFILLRINTEPLVFRSCNILITGL